MCRIFYCIVAQGRCSGTDRGGCSQGLGEHALFRSKDRVGIGGMSSQSTCHLSAVDR